MSTKWQETLNRWGLDVPHFKRVERAEAIVDERAIEPEGLDTWKVHYHHIVTIAGGQASCTCPDFVERQKARGQACKYIVALAMSQAGGAGSSSASPVPLPLPEPAPAPIEATARADAEPSPAVVSEKPGRPREDAYVGWQAGERFARPGPGAGQLPHPQRG